MLVSDTQLYEQHVARLLQWCLLCFGQGQNTVLLICEDLFLQKGGLCVKYHGLGEIRYITFDAGRVQEVSFIFFERMG